MYDLKGKVVVVTGAARGLGFAIATMFKQCGADVVVSDVRPVGAEAARAIDAAWVQADVTNEADAARLIQTAVSAFGRLDVLVNNAGIMGLAPLEEISLAEWNHMLAVHLTGTFLCTKVGLPIMKSQGSGKVINIASNWGQRGAAEAVHYSTAKAGIIGFTKALAREVGPSGILVNAVAPGPIETEMIEEEARLLHTTVDAVRASLTTTIPLGRLGQPSDVAAATCFLASAHGDFFCGQVISPNGGEVM